MDTTETADFYENAGAVWAVEEPQAGQLGPQRPVVADRGGPVGRLYYGA